MTRARCSSARAASFQSSSRICPISEQRKALYAGLGVVVFDGPQGHGFYKGSHDNQTDNTMACIEKSQRCVVILSNDIRSETGFADLVHFILGDTGVPYTWAYARRENRCPWAASIHITGAPQPRTACRVPSDTGDGLPDRTAVEPRARRRMDRL